MQYTDSDAYVTHGGTGHRMHQDSAPIPTVLSAKDANMVIWSLMKVLEAGGVAGATFDPSTPATYDRLLKAIRATGIPVGSTLFGYYSTAPDGYILGDGELFVRASRPELTAHVIAQGLVVSEVAWAAGSHTLFGAGDGSTTMRAPDLRGEHPRGWDNGRGVDAGRGLGTWQDQMLLAHTHGLKVFSRDLSSDGSDEGDDSVRSASAAVSGFIEATGGAENRVRTAALNWVIKA